MKPILFALTALVATIPSLTSREIPMDISQQAKPATMKVLVKKDQDRILLEAKGRYHIYDPDTQVLLTSGIRTKRDFLSLDPSGLRWNESFPGIHQIRIVPADNKSSILIDGIEYKGCVEIYDLKDKLFFINEVDLERYLKATLTFQFPQEFDEEVMDALAIVARTNAYFIASRAPNSFWTVDAQEVGYQGDALVLQNRHIDRAIDNTQHMVLTYEGTPFAATWTKDSAGTTADYTTMYRKTAHAPGGVHSALAAKDREGRGWSFSLSKGELAKALGLATLTAFDLYQDKQSHKVYGAKVKDRLDSLTLDFFKLQKALGASRLKSSDFAIQVEKDTITFRGFGEGVGVGLCLFGASAMADKGDKAPKILSTFFPKTELTSLRTF